MWKRSGRHRSQLLLLLRGTSSSPAVVFREGRVVVSRPFSSNTDSESYSQTESPYRDQDKVNTDSTDMDPPPFLLFVCLGPPSSFNHHFKVQLFLFITRINYLQNLCTKLCRYPPSLHTHSHTHTPHRRKETTMMIQ